MEYSEKHERSSHGDSDTTAAGQHDYLSNKPDHSNTSPEYAALLQFIAESGQRKAGAGEADNGERVEKSRIWYKPWVTRETRFDRAGNVIKADAARATPAEW
jgi:hypothetical protein